MFKWFRFKNEAKKVYLDIPGVYWGKSVVHKNMEGRKSYLMKIVAVYNRQ